jgi:hypothetical protein
MIEYSITSQFSASGQNRNVLFDGVDIVNSSLSNMTPNDYKKVLKFLRFFEVKEDTSNAGGTKMALTKTHFVILNEEEGQRLIGTVCVDLGPYEIANPFCL